MTIFRFSAAVVGFLLAGSFAVGQGGPSLPPDDLEAVANVNDYWIPGVTSSWAEAIENAVANDRIKYVYFPGGLGEGDGDGSYLFTEPFTISKGELTFYGDGTIIRGFYPVDFPNPDLAGTQLKSTIQFGLSGASGGDILDLSDVTISGLTFDANGFVEFGSLIRWNGDDIIHNVLLENLEFFDSTGAPHVNETDPGNGTSDDDWSINLGGFGRLTDVYVRGCTHGSMAMQSNLSRHQFLTCGFKQLNDQEYALVEGLYIYDNLIENGSRTIAIDVTANRDSYVELRDVHIYNNVITNTWRWAISTGFDSAESSGGEPRSMLIDGMFIMGNFIEWNEKGDEYSSSQPTSAIRLRIGDGVENDFRNIVIQGNTVLDVGHEAKPIMGVSVAGGITDQPLQVQIIDNVIPSFSLANVNHSEILASNNHSATTDGPAAEVDLDAHNFDRVNDFPNLTQTLKLQLSSLDISFRLYVPEHDERSFLFHSDENNYILLKSDTDRSLQIRIDGVLKTLITADKIQENKIYEIRILGIPDSGGSVIRSYYRLQGSLDEFQPGAAAHFFTADNLPIRSIGAAILDGLFLETSLPFQGLLWDIHLQDGLNDPVIFTGTNQNPQFGPWRDLAGPIETRVHGILTPLIPYDFGEQNDIPVPKLPILKNLDDLDIQFSFYTTNLIDEPYLFYGPQGDSLQLQAGGKVSLKVAGIPVPLHFSRAVTEYQSHHLRIRDTEPAKNQIRLRGYLDGQIFDFGPNSPDIGNAAGQHLQFESIGGQIGNSGNRLRGALWNIELSSSNAGSDDEFYQGAVRYVTIPWRDLDHQGNIFTRNDAVPTPRDPFVFREIVIPALINRDEPVTIGWQDLDISFNMKIDDLGGNSYIFYFSSQHNLELIGGLGPNENEGRLSYRIGNLTFPISYAWFEEGGTYAVRIYSEEGAFKIKINGTNAGAGIPYPADHPDPVFKFSAIGGRVVDGFGSRLFNGMLWDVSVKDVRTGQPVAYYPGDYQGSNSYPWTDVSGNGNHMVNIKVVR